MSRLDLGLLEDEGQMADLHRTAGECNHERCCTLTAVRPLAKVYVLYHAVGSTSVPSRQWAPRSACTAGSFHSQASDAPRYPQQMHTACWLSIPVPVLYNQRNGDTVFLSSFNAASFSASEKIGGYLWVSCESLHKAVPAHR